MPILTGFGMPFFGPGWYGFALAFGLIPGGSWLLRDTPQCTRRWLDADPVCNRLLRTDGVSIPRDPDPPRDEPARRN